ncbi:hypothetical protein Tco_0103408 [Tanacetum coccineum]
MGLPLMSFSRRPRVQVQLRLVLKLTMPRGPTPVVGWLMGVVNPTRSLDDVSNDVSCRWRLMIGTRFQVASQLAYGIVPRVHGDEKCIDVRRMYEVSRSNRCSSLGEFHWWKQCDMTSSLARNASSVLTI